MYLLFMAIRPETSRPDAAALTEMVLALDAENEKLRVLMRTLNDISSACVRKRLAAIVAEQLAQELDDLATGVTPPLPANDDTPATKPPRGAHARRRGEHRRTAQALAALRQVIEPDTTACRCCAGRLHKIGEDVNEVLDVIRRSCGCCARSVPNMPAAAAPMAWCRRRCCHD